MKLPCAVTRDLLPLYAENMVEQETKVLIEEHLPGDRDFYHDHGPESKFYRKAQQEGLCIREQTFGMNKLYLIELNELYEIGMQLWKQYPEIMLCDDPECSFCNKWNHR